MQAVLEAANIREMTRRKNSSNCLIYQAKLTAKQDPTKCEVFIVEGDSAGGINKDRDRRSQAILPMRENIKCRKSAL